MTGEFKDKLISYNYLYSEGYKIFQKYRDNVEAVQILKEIEQMLINAPEQKLSNGRDKHE